MIKWESQIGLYSFWFAHGLHHINVLGLNILVQFVDVELSHVGSGLKHSHSLWLVLQYLLIGFWHDWYKVDCCCSWQWLMQQLSSSRIQTSAATSVSFLMLLLSNWLPLSRTVRTRWRHGSKLLSPDPSNTCSSLILNNDAIWEKYEEFATNSHLLKQWYY